MGTVIDPDRLGPRSPEPRRRRDHAVAAHVLPAVVFEMRSPPPARRRQRAAPVPRSSALQARSEPLPQGCRGNSVQVMTLMPTTRPARASPEAVDLQATRGTSRLQRSPAPSNHRRNPRSGMTRNRQHDVSTEDPSVLAESQCRISWHFSPRIRPTSAHARTRRTPEPWRARGRCSKGLRIRDAAGSTTPA